jgi:hypothetical protein
VRAGGNAWRASRCLSVLLVVSLLATACATGPNTTAIDLFRLAPESAENKAMQTRQFEAPDSNELLSASAAVLQDLGFQVTESSHELGFLSAAKERSAREYGQETTRGFVAFFTLLLSAVALSNVTYVMPVDLHQQISASLISQPIRDDDKRQALRIVFFRLVWKGDGSSGSTTILPGQQKMEMIRDPQLYRQFFSKLSKAVFLEAHKI